MGSALQDQTKQLGVVVVVLKTLSGRLVDLKVGEHQLRQVRIKVGDRLFIPWKIVKAVSNSRPHRQKIFDRDRIEPAFLKFWQIVGDRIVDALDKALGK